MYSCEYLLRNGWVEEVKEPTLREKIESIVWNRKGHSPKVTSEIIVEAVEEHYKIKEENA